MEGGGHWPGHGVEGVHPGLRGRSIQSCSVPNIQPGQSILTPWSPESCGLSLPHGSPISPTFFSHLGRLSFRGGCQVSKFCVPQSREHPLPQNMTPCLQITFPSLSEAIPGCVWAGSILEPSQKGACGPSGMIFTLRIVCHEDTFPWHQVHFCCQRSLWNEQAVWGCHGEAGPFGGLSCATCTSQPLPSSLTPRCPPRAASALCSDPASQPASQPGSSISIP